jgi:CubicO group peptidase (beta-lactamase class C family)
MIRPSAQSSRTEMPVALIAAAPLMCSYRRRSLSRVLLVGAGFLFSACAQLPGSGKPSINPVPLDAFMQRVEQDVVAGIIPGAVLLVARDGQVLYRKAVGKQDPKADKPMAMDSLFRIYSMSKPIVSVATLTLIEDGKTTACSAVPWSRVSM